MSNRKELYYMLSITIMIFLTVVFAVTFSYVGRANVTGNTNTNIAILGNATFSYTGVTTLSLSVTEANLASSNGANNYSSYVRSSLRNTNITLTSDSDQLPYGLTCDYEIVYTPTVAFEKSPAAVAANLKELTIQGLMDGTTKFNVEIAGEDEIVLYSGTISTTIDTASIMQKWRFRAYFYNLNVDQNSAAGQNPKGVISIRNGECRGKKAYWFDTSTCTYSNPCTHPNYGGALQTSGPDTGHNAYIGQDSSIYYACATIQGHEVCLSQPYTQYRLSDHTLNTSFTSAQQTNAKQAIYQAFINAGITVDIDNNCSAGGSYASCLVGGLGCGVRVNGYVYCGDSSGGVSCDVDPLGRAYCVS